VAWSKRVGGPFHLDEDEYDEQRHRSNNTGDCDGIAPSYVTAPVKTKEKSESCSNETEGAKEVDSSELLPPVRIFDRGNMQDEVYGYKSNEAQRYLCNEKPVAALAFLKRRRALI